MRHPRSGYEGRHRRHATGALITRDHRGHADFGRPSPLQLSAATAVLASASMLAGVAGPASAAQDTARTATAQAAVAVSETVPIVSNESAHRYIALRGGRFVVDTREAGESGALNSADALAASLNRLVAAPVHTGNIVLTAATTGGTTTYDLLPGVVLTIGSDYIRLSLSKQIVTDIEDLAAIGQAVAGLVGAILAVSGVTGGSSIAAIVSDSIGIGADAFKLCVGTDGSATFTISLTSLFSCSGLSDLAA